MGIGPARCGVSNEGDEQAMKIVITRLDKLFSEYIRRRAIFRSGGCERCSTAKYDIQKDNGSILPAYKQLQTSHFWGRANRGVRYDEDNAAGLCPGCHMYLGGHPYEHSIFFRERLGQVKYDELMLRAHKVHKVDYAAVELYLRQKLEDLQEAIGV